MKKRIKSYLAALFIMLLLMGCAGEGKEEIITEEPGEEQNEAEPYGEEDIDTSGEKEYDVAEEKTKEICIFICGAVKSPGVYYLPEGARLYEAVAAAGGFREDADTQWRNQAELLEDGVRIQIFTCSETEELEENGQNPDLESQGKADAGDAASDRGRININTASLEELQEIPGIGEAKAQAILAYRQENGSFASCEEIQQVSGIKGKTFEKIKSFITIR